MNQNVKQKPTNFDDAIDVLYKWFTFHRNSGSLCPEYTAKDMLDDRTWPSYNTLSEYRDYLYTHNAYSGAIKALEGAWRSYKAYLQRNRSPKVKKQISPKSIIKNRDSRKIVYISNVTSIPFTERIVEKFNVGDKAWISWNGRKAIPVTILEADDRYYTFRTERPFKTAGNEYYLRLDEVRSTPELACMNYVTL